ncbi:MAG: hypothetical protein HZB19_21985 [Chloroflexi bacterium]|nr:hypothetical protein [Chloroflexota bacterium]
MTNKSALQRRIRFLLLFFAFALTVSGLTAIPLRWELDLLDQWFGVNSFMSQIWPSMAEWISRVNNSVQNGYGQYPLLAYGTDWLAFEHVVIAVAFIGPLRDPVKNIWVIEFGMVACILIIPWALIFGVVRDIPLFWTLIDMSFGIFGFIPLWLVRKDILRLQTMT